MDPSLDIPAAYGGPGAPYQLPAFVGGDLDQSVGLAPPPPVAPGQAPALDVGQLAPPAPPPGLVAGLPDGPPVPATPAAPSPENQLEAPHPPTEAEKLDYEVGRQRALIDKDPAAWATENAKREEDKQKAADEEEALIRAQERKAQLDHMQMLENASAKANMDSAADYQHAQQLHIDQGHWWQTRTTGQKVASYISAMIGGFLAPYHGGKNSGLDAINDAINQDIDVQTKNMGSQRDAIAAHQNMVAQAYDRTRDLARAQDTARLAMFQGALEQINKARAKVDPLGSQAQPLVAAGLGVQNAIAQQQQAMQQRNLDNNIKQGDLQVKQAGALETSRHNKADEGAKRQELALKREEQAQKAATEGQLTPKELRAQGLPQLPDVNGKPLIAPSDEEAKSTRKALAATNNAARSLDHLVSLVEKNGWKSDFVKSKEWREAKSEFASVIPQIQHAEGFQRLTDMDLKLIQDQLATTDPTELRDTVAAGLKQARANLVDNFNGDLQSIAPTAARYEPPRYQAASAADIGDPLHAPGAPSLGPDLPEGGMRRP